ncbi:MAG: hypothetical protein WKG01_28015 [Kofleriaceae bacterium]
MRSSVRFASRPLAVTTATLELFHLFSPRPDWILDAAVDGPIPRLWLSGVVAGTPLPGPSRLEVAYIDAPKLVTLDGSAGALAFGDTPARLELVELGEGKARVTGLLALRWVTSVREPRAYEIELDVIAALIT